MLSPQSLRHSLIISLIEWPVTICFICYWKAIINYFINPLSRSWEILKSEYKSIDEEYSNSENHPHEATRAVVIQQLSPDAFGDEYDWL